jgi:hypothetical protein
VPNAKEPVDANKAELGLLAPLANAVIFPRSFVKITTRLSYSPDGADDKTIPVSVTASLIKTFL